MLILPAAFLYQKRYEIVGKFYQTGTYLNERTDLYKFGPVWTPEQHSNLLDYLKSNDKVYTIMKYDEFITEQMGEATPILPDGSCPHLLQLPSRNLTFCSFAQRADVGKHYVTFGGRSGLRESMITMNSRQLFFTKYVKADWDSPLWAPLLRSKAYQDAS